MTSQPSIIDIEKGRATYRMLMGCNVDEMVIADDFDFDAHVFACLIAVAASEEGTLTERLGLAGDDLAALIKCWFGHAADAFTLPNALSIDADDDEIAMVRDLLLANRSKSTVDGSWLAAMMARRAMEPNHLWEDLGLRNRNELSRLLGRHFGPLAARNTKNMRWKRFFYRTLCEDDGLVMCTTPVCTACGDFELCFSDESGDSRLAYRRRAIAMGAAA